MKNAGFFASVLVILAAFGALLYAPPEAIAGAKQGLSVCAGVIVPSLLPFLILSGALTGLGVPRLLARAAGGAMGRVFGVSGAAAAPLLLGLTGGYPVGASAVADLVRREELTPEEGSRLLPFCNNTGPAFLIGAAGSGVFHSARLGLLLYLSHVLAALGLGLLLSVGRPGPQTREPAAAPALRTLAKVLPEAVKGAVAATLNICGFVVFFSVITALLEALGVFTEAAGWLAARLGLELHFARALLTGLLELGSGVGAMAGLDSAPGNLALASFLLGFGSLSVHCQTLAAVADTEIKIARHFAGRLLHGLLAAGITLGLFPLFAP